MPTTADKARAKIARELDRNQLPARIDVKRHARLWQAVAHVTLTARWIGADNTPQRPLPHALPMLA